MCLRRKKKGKSKVLSGRFCVRDLEAEHYNFCIFITKLQTVTLQLLDQIKQTGFAIENFRFAPVLLL